MGFDVDALRAAIDRHGAVARVVVAEVRGSSPREVGAAMLVWDSGQEGTIGGGALEMQAAQAARAGRVGLSRHALGPDLGQCCGGAVVLLTEVYDSVEGLEGDVIARPVGAVGEMPLAVRRLLVQARAQGVPVRPQLVEGWMVEPVHRPARQVWIWGAGHVGRALVGVLAPLPDVAITWVDTAPDRFPEAVPEGVTVLPAAKPAELVRHAPPAAEHLVLTYSHALDLELCDRLLRHDFAFAGLIGSATKWARFRTRLAALGHPPERIARITCPIGEPGLGKHPQAIAVGVAADLLRRREQGTEKKDMRA
ncbi:xanthine dehydrogenase accessory protein XdhC [Jhaorihella thermophila]|uniref:Xanthine dehydrogenase accessory factor n=1 Tax=Jhaorihella thermophila TaxID=488547 RepID=A0A1H5XRD5_9RHOB|nr:xanthine dehydrogenase accessory protein XdhC [Jhaorihella thermophila]SEG14359.1 xanthine dehydrogenase accessory factor [Jhaorihella thermophila]